MSRDCCTMHAKSSKNEHFLAFAYGIPLYRNGHGARRALVAQLRQYECKRVRVDHNSFGHARGYAWLHFANEKDRDDCCVAVNGKLYVPLYTHGAGRVTNEDTLQDSSNTEVPREMITDSQRDDDMEKCYLSVSPCYNVKLCQSFPSASPEIRSQLRLDPVSSYSITDEITAHAMSEVCQATLSVLCSHPGSSAHALSHSCTRQSGFAIDGTAGAGGNAAAMIRSRAFRRVIAYEMHPQRAEDLCHNLHILCGPVSDGVSDWEVRSRNVVVDLLSAIHSNSVPWTADRTIDTLFLDPPWGGLSYRQDMSNKTAVRRDGVRGGFVDLFLGRDTETSRPDLSDATDSPSVEMSLSQLLAEELTKRISPDGAALVRIAAVKVPSDFDATSLCAAVTATTAGKWDIELPSGDIIPYDVWNSEDLRELRESGGKYLDSRPHPFRLQMGGKTALILIAYPPFFRNSHLDGIVKALHDFDVQRGQEYHPRYFDWEKQKWVSLRHWKGCNMTLITK